MHQHPRRRDHVGCVELFHGQLESSATVKNLVDVPIIVDDHSRRVRTITVGAVSFGAAVRSPPMRHQERPYTSPIWYTPKS
jgi:hypothetical protein